MATATDYHGAMRIVDGRCDIGCFELTTFERDTLPRLTVSTPASGSTFSNEEERITISGTYADDHGVRRITCNGARLGAVHNGTWRHALALRTGRNTLRYIAEDSAGQAATVKVSYTRLPAPVVPTVTNAVEYVALDGSHTWPFASWSTAATSIHEAVAAAVDGGLIMVGSGVHAVADLTLEHAVTLAGAYGAGATELRADGAHRCLLLDHPGAVVRHLTLSGGYAYFGAGVFSTDRGTIDSCIVARNHAFGAGGGLYFARGGRITNTVIAHNIAGTDGGGAAVRADTILVDCSVRNNVAFGNGGGVHCGTHAELLRGTVTDNVASNYGGGVYADMFSVVRRSALADNMADFGGGVCAWEGALIDRCTVVRNAARDAGGIGGMAGVARNCLVARNHSRRQGAGISFDFGTIQNCTVADNINRSGPGGVSMWHGGWLVNTIVRRNTSRSGAANLALRGGVRIESSCLPASHARRGSVTRGPRFINPRYGNYRLRAGSPCIDRGTLTLWMYASDDLDGAPRVAGPMPDIGAYEFAPALRRDAVGYLAGDVHLSHADADVESVPEPMIPWFAPALLLVVRRHNH
jgi:hypothetical protein